ncbi:MAG: zinc ribbon domain-containing protein, partial [Lachnospiraceae bacterium]|nr:zinc ribbon domain-containing protein [Lachnospiraceae bacterium]
MFCRQCGIQISDDAAYCRGCGAKVIKAETVDCISDTVGQRVGGDSGEKEKQKSSAIGVWIIVIVSLGVAGLAIWLLFLFLRWLLSAFIPAVAVIAGGYILYHKVLAKVITGYFYDRTSKEIHLPEGMTASSLLETLSGKFNYPYFKGVHYGADGECVIEGKYAMYPVCFGENNITEISYIAEADDKKKRTVLLETLTIRDYINKFFNPNLPVDVTKDMKKLKLAEGQRKAVAVVCAIASVLIAAVIVWDYITPGSLQSMAV